MSPIIVKFYEIQKVKLLPGSGSLAVTLATDVPTTWLSGMVVENAWLALNRGAFRFTGATCIETTVALVFTGNPGNRYNTI